MSSPVMIPSVADMTWNQFHQRMAFMADLIDRAAEAPDSALHFNSNAPDIERLFGSEEGLLLALQQRWMTALAAKLDQAHYDGVPAELARAELAAQQPGLRALLDAAAARSVRVRALQHREPRLEELFDGVPFGLQTIA
ncbi:hypothetical protein [Mycolicibacter terrae]|nr:hypothetical protein [Mycolicibacter terrae]